MEQERIEKLREEMLEIYPKDQVINALNSLAFLPKENYEKFSRNIQENRRRHHLAVILEGGFILLK